MCQSPSSRHNLEAVLALGVPKYSSSNRSSSSSSMLNNNNDNNGVHPTAVLPLPALYREMSH
jgi:hypothetical protein